MHCIVILANASEQPPAQTRTGQLHIPDTSTSNWWTNRMIPTRCDHRHSGTGTGARSCATGSENNVGQLHSAYPLLSHVTLKGSLSPYVTQRTEVSALKAPPRCTTSQLWWQTYQHHLGESTLTHQLALAVSAVAPYSSLEDTGRNISPLHSITRSSASFHDRMPAVSAAHSPV